MSALEDRRQRAREEAWTLEINDPRTDVEVAVEIATQVRITHTVISAYRPNLTEGSEAWHKVRRRLTAAFEAAGFEVIE